MGDAPERPPATPLTPASDLPFHLHVEVLGLEEAEVKAVFPHLDIQFDSAPFIEKTIHSLLHFFHIYKIISYYTCESNSGLSILFC